MRNGIAEVRLGIVVAVPKTVHLVSNPRIWRWENAALCVFSPYAERTCPHISPGLLLIISGTAANMEEVPHCVLHHRRLVEYVCPLCENLPMCETCKLEHSAGTGHAPEDCKEVGLALMQQHIQQAGGKQTIELAKVMRRFMKEFETGFLREIEKFQSSSLQAEGLRKMQKLASDEKYAELYFYAKGLLVGDVKNETAVKELNKRLLKMIDTASNGLENVRNNIIAAAQYKPVFAVYQKGKVLVLRDDSYNEEEKVISALKDADMSKFKAVYIYPGLLIGDRVASELASCLQAYPVSALYLEGHCISDAGMQALAQVAFSNKSLSVFCVISGYISDTGAKAVAEAARSRRSLTTFYLSGGYISDFGAIAVAESVKSCPISTFYLSGKQISNEAAIAVATAMKGCPLSAFCLWSALISDSGAIAVTEAVKGCALSTFCLGGRQISDEGATAVAKILSSECSSTLSAFCLWSCSISDICAGKIADVVRSWPLLSGFYIDGAPTSGETLVYVLNGMSNIRTTRSVNLCIRGISKGQVDSCLSRVQQDGVGRLIKLRLQCGSGPDKDVCGKLAAECGQKLEEFRVVPDIFRVFQEEVVIGVPK